MVEMVMSLIIIVKSVKRELKMMSVWDLNNPMFKNSKSWKFVKRAPRRTAWISWETSAVRWGTQSRVLIKHEQRTAWLKKTVRLDLLIWIKWNKRSAEHTSTIINTHINPLTTIDHRAPSLTSIIRRWPSTIFKTRLVFVLIMFWFFAYW